MAGHKDMGASYHLAVSVSPGTRGDRRAALLRELAREKSASVPDLSSRAKVSQPAALVALIELEEKGLVRLTGEGGAEHVRIAAITEAGRQELTRL